jgi:hypothetical protein
MAETRTETISKLSNPQWRTRANSQRRTMLLQQERAGVKIAVDPDEIRAVLRVDSNS